MIQPLLNGMLTILLAKFFLNDLPHAAGLAGKPDYERDPTSGQLRYIALLSQELKITIVYEERVRTFGEAGRVISELKAEKKYRKQLGSGNPSTVPVYHITDSRNLDGILSKGLLRGDSLYIFFLYDHDIAYNQARAMAEEGDGCVLLEVTLTPEDVSKCEIGELFPDLYIGRFGTDPPDDMQLVDYLKAPVQYGTAEVSCKVDRIPPGRIKVIERFGAGTCYGNAWRWLIKEEAGTLVHGTVHSLGKRMGHAWVETDAGYIWEPQTGGFFTYNSWQTAAEPIEESRYTAEEAAIMAARSKHHGPWSEEERMRYLRR